MEKAVGDMNLLQVLVYLDDVIVFGKTLEEHEDRLLKVLDRLGEVGLKLSVDKCQICLPRVKYLGHIVSADGVAPDPKKIDAVTTWPMPTNLKTLQSFLGFCDYYSRFIQSYSEIVRPLTELTKGVCSNSEDHEVCPKGEPSLLERIGAVQEKIGQILYRCVSSHNPLSDTCACPGICQPTTFIHPACGCKLEGSWCCSLPGTP